MDPRNNPHVSLFSFSSVRPPPLYSSSPPFLPQNCFLRCVSLTHFPSRSPIRGYLNLLTAQSARDRLPIRACRWFHSSAHPSSPSPRTDSYINPRVRVYSLFLPLSLVLPLSSPVSLATLFPVLHFYYILLRPREISLFFFFFSRNNRDTWRDVDVNNWNTRSEMHWCCDFAR